MFDCSFTVELAAGQCSLSVFLTDPLLQSYSLLLVFVFGMLLYSTIIIVETCFTDGTVNRGSGCHYSGLLL